MRRVPVMKKICVLAVVLMFISSAAFGAMSTFLSYTAEGAGISIDAVGVTSSGNVSAEIPANATIYAAYLYSAAVWSGGLYDVEFDGNTLTSSAASRLDVGGKQANATSENRWDVTSIVAARYDSVGGTYNFTVTENGYLDGEILAVVYSVEGGETRTAMIFDGELATTGDTFNINLSDEYDGSDAIFSLGISFGYQSNLNPPAQYTVIDVNDGRLTSSAGGEDDGYSSNGGLITAGGVGDSIANPADPYSHGDGYDYDDELYNLAPFLTVGGNLITIATLNPSNDDNVFFAALTVRGEAIPDDVNPAVPEPATMILLGSGLLGLAGFRKRIIKK